MKDSAAEVASEIDRRWLRPRGLAVQRDPEGRTNKHLRWMVEQMQDPLFTRDKAMRWLGYIQGALVWSGHATLEEMKDLNR